MINPDIEERIREWVEFDRETKAEIENLLMDKKKNEKELVDRFYKKLEFGTGGLRGIIGAGTNRMNIYTVGMVATGISNYIIKNKEPNPSVVIAYDSRNMSDIFSLRSALIFAANKIKVYLFNILTPTPVLSFAIRELNATAGIMVTASHNPPEYNGYKVYYKDGAQVIAPHDIGIIKEVDDIKSIREIKITNEEDAEKEKLLVYLDSSFYRRYYDKIITLLPNPDIISQGNIKVVFTPLHGAAKQPIEEALKKVGLEKLYIVKEQAQPDGNFPTVSYPNPEEPDALKLAIELAKKEKADILFATDPDGDRLGVGANDGNNNFVLFNGNQIGILFTYYMLRELKKNNALSENSLVIKTIVSTNLVQEICKYFNVHLEEVLTGFKYIAERVKIYHDIEQKKNREFILGFEESFGYNLGDFVRDKDSVISALLITEISTLCKNNGKTLTDLLDEIYKEFGYHFETLESITLKGKIGINKIKDIMNFFRSNPPKKINDAELLKIRDVRKGTITDIKTNKQTELSLPKSNVLTFYLADNSSITLRPSGTEPKIKFYFSCSMKGKDLDEEKEEVHNNIEQLTNNFMGLVKGLL